MTAGLGIEDIKIALKDMVQDLCQEFGERLIAVVVYGSHARGTGTPASDVDLLVVVRGLVRDWEVIHRLEDEWAQRGRRWGKRFQITLASPEDVEDSVEWTAPLMLEIYRTHVIVFDRDDLFGDCVLHMGRLIEERGIQLRKPGVWEVPERAVSS